MGNPPWSNSPTILWTVYDRGPSECVLFDMTFLDDGGDEDTVYCRWTPATGELVCDEGPKEMTP